MHIEIESASSTSSREKIPIKGVAPDQFLVEPKRTTLVTTAAIAKSKRGCPSSLDLPRTTIRPEGHRGAPPLVALEPRRGAPTKPYIDSFLSSVSYPVRIPLPPSLFWTPREPKPSAVGQAEWNSGELEPGGRETPPSALLAPPPLPSLISPVGPRPDG
jgi:hypothetical protein